MRSIPKSVRVEIRRLYFASVLSFERIAEQLDVPLATVRSAVVIDGGAVPVPSTGPYAKESDS
jgi:hypothetical protein